MSFASPAKQDRIDRHLSRQRGAGVRAIATSFGFTFGASSPHTTVSVPIAEPTVKRRKLDDQDTIRDAQQHSNPRESEAAKKHGSRPEARRRFEAIQEVTEIETKLNEEKDSFMAIKKTAKTRAASKAPKPQPLAVDSPPMVAKDKTSSRRPRRQAATRAIDQVSRGFMQEAQNVDKLRRGQETVPSKRTRTRKATEVTETRSFEEVSAAASSGETKQSSTVKSVRIPKPKGEANEAVEPGKKTTRGRPPKPKIEYYKTDTEGIPDQETLPSAARLPLAETTANPIVRSKSAEKSSKYSDDPVAHVPPKSPLRVRSPQKPLEESKNIAQGKRKPPKFTISNDPPAAKLEPDVVGVSKAVESENVPNFSGSRSKITEKHNAALGQLQGCATDDTALVKCKKKPGIKPTEALGAAVEQHILDPEATLLARPGRNGPAKAQRSKRDQKQGGKPIEEPTSTITAAVEQPANDDTDVDWLLTDKHTSKRTLAKRQARDVKRRPLKNTAELPDVDLDDLLSNIATYVPRSLEPTTGFAGRWK